MNRILLVFVVLILCSVILGAGVYYWKEYTLHFEAGALASLEALYAIQKNHSTEKGFYGGSFAELGVPLGATLHGTTLTWDNGYIYQIYDLSRDRSGQVIGYAISARPASFKAGSKKSYLLDQTGKIFVTTEDRAANRSDRSINLAKQ